MHCKQMGREKLPFLKVGRSSEKFENHCIHLFNYKEKMLKFSKLLALFFVVRLSHSQTSKCQNKPGDAAADWAIVYKAPGQDRGKIIFATVAGIWDDGAQPLSNVNQHSFAKALEHVVADNNDIKFIAYNNVPPSVPSVKTKSNSKGVIILSTAANSAAWIVHTVPGFPTARTPYSWPVAENARGHLLICLTISKSQINAIAASLLLVQPMVHYNDIPETETAGMPYFNKLAGGKIPTLPPFTSRRSIRTENAAGPVAVHIYSKSRSSKYAASLLLVQPMVHYNDIPETETAGMPYFKKLAEGKVPSLPPFTSRRSIRTEDARSPVAVHIYSKSESSKYGELKWLYEFQIILIRGFDM
ncbi:Deoxyribonuclease-2-alpha [Trichinella sp. T8]|nr:Deoxyribonuclease-2-alpha [Trichinella sp. T8]